MKFIIHHNTDLTPQIETCRQVLEATTPCSPDCEVCAYQTNLNQLAQNFMTAWYERGYKEEYDKITIQPKSAFQKIRQKSIEVQKKLTMADLELVHKTLYIGSLEAQVEELEQWKKEALTVLGEIDIQKVGKLMGLTVGQAVLPNVQGYIELLLAIRKEQAARIDAMQKVVDAAVSLAKEANYLHPFSLEVGEKVDNLQRAVQTWLKPVDVKTPKS